MNILPFENEIRIAGLIILGLVTVWLLRHKPRCAAGVIMGFGWYDYFTTNLGFVLDAGKLLGIICACYIVLHPQILKNPSVRFLRRTWLPYWIYCIGITVVMVPFWPEASGGASGMLYTTLRWFVQLVTMGLGFCVAIVIAGITTSTARLHESTRILVFSAVILAVVGLYQFVAYPRGLPINTIARQGGLVNTIAASKVDGERTFRPYSLAGEPKGFATSLCIPLVLLFFFGNRAEVMPFKKWLRIPLLVGFGVAMFLTLSTAGFLIITIVIITAMIAMAHIRVGLSKAIRNSISAAVVGSVAVLVMSADSVIDRVETVYQSRVEERVQTDLFTYGELGVFDLWRDSPGHFVTGVGRGGSSFYIRQYRDDYAGYTAAARGIVGEMADIGLIGAVLLYVPLIAMLHQLGILIRNTPNSHDFVVAYLFCCCGVPMMLTKAAWIFPFTVIGMSVCLYSLVLSRGRSNRPVLRASVVQPTQNRLALNQR
jgi:hypothetical protein